MAPRPQSQQRELPTATTSVTTSVGTSVATSGSPLRATCPGDSGKVRHVDSERSTRQKISEWVRRYLPLEIAGWVGELGAAAGTYWLTGSFAAAVVAGTIGASVGYYATAYNNGVRWSYRDEAHRPWLMRVLVANFRSLRSIAIEFGPAEVIDSIVFRPIFLYAGPFLLGNVVVGWILGSIAADVVFYLMAIVSYERFTVLLVRPSVEEVSHESTPTIAAA